MKLCCKVGVVWTFTVLLLLVASARGGAQAVDPLIMKMAANEKQTLTKLGQYSPMVETYLQLVGKNGEQPVADRYFLHRINLGKTMRRKRCGCEADSGDHNAPVGKCTCTVIRSAVASELDRSSETILRRHCDC